MLDASARSANWQTLHVEIDGATSAIWHLLLPDWRSGTRINVYQSVKLCYVALKTTTSTSLSFTSLKKYFI